MLRPTLLLTALLGLLGLSFLPSCGLGCPSAGDTCDKEGAEAADDELTPLRCYQGKWVTGKWSGENVCCGDACVIA